MRIIKIFVVGVLFLFVGGRAAYAFPIPEAMGVVNSVLPVLAAGFAGVVGVFSGVFGYRKRVGVSVSLLLIALFGLFGAGVFGGLYWGEVSAMERLMEVNLQRNPKLFRPASPPEAARVEVSSGVDLGLSLDEAEAFLMDNPDLEAVHIRTDDNWGTAWQMGYHDAVRISDFLGNLDLPLAADFPNMLVVSWEKGESNGLNHSAEEIYNLAYRMEVEGLEMPPLLLIDPDGIASRALASVVSMQILPSGEHIEIYYLESGFLADEPRDNLDIGEGGARAVSVGEMAELVEGRSDDILFFDVRSRLAHEESGYPPHSGFGFYMDLLFGRDWRDNPPFYGEKREILFFSWTGWRSHIIADYYALMGYDTAYLDGGLEAYDASGAFRLPDYPNRNRLWQRDDLLSLLLGDEDVSLIDLRDNADLTDARLPIPRSIHIPIWELSGEELEERLDDLPVNGRYVGLVFDKRTGFQAMRLGQILRDRGEVWLGLDALPFGISYMDIYTPLGMDRDDFIAPHLAKQERAAARAEVFSGLKMAYEDYLWFLPLALFPFFLAIGVKLVFQPLYMLPLVVGGGKWSDILRVVVDILAFVWLVSAVLFYQEWLADFYSFDDGFLLYDSSHILPVMASLFVMLIIIMAVGYYRKIGVWIGALFGAVLTLWLLWGAGKALLVFLLGLMFITILGEVFGVVWELWKNREPLNLDYVGGRFDVGAKARRLAEYKGKFGCKGDVAKGVVLKGEMLLALMSLDAKAERAFNRAVSGWGDVGLILRSAALVEDLSMVDAGLYLTCRLPLLEGESLGAGQTGWFEALQKVYDAMVEKGAVAGVLVQPLIEADFAGVAFSRSPDEVSKMQVEWGQGAAVTDGDSRVRSLKFDEGSVPKNKDVDLELIAEALRQGEKQLGEPVDMEFLQEGGRLWITQLRPMVDFSAADAFMVEAVNLRDAGKGVVWHTDFMADSLRMPSILTASLMVELYGGAVRAAFGRLFAAETGVGFSFWGVFRERFGIGGGISVRMREFYERHLEYIRGEKLLDLGRADLGQLIGIFENRVKKLKEEHFPFSIAVTKFALENPLAVIEGADWCDMGVGAAMSRALAAGDELGFVENFGHRASVDFELDCPRYSEKLPVMGKNKGGNFVIDDGEALIYRATAKDDVHSWLTEDFALIRGVMLEIGARLGLGDEVFALNYEEVLGLLEYVPPSKKLVSAAERQALLAARNLPPLLNELDIIDMIKNRGNKNGNISAAKRGKVIIASPLVENIRGVVLFIDRAEDIGKEDATGKIIIARQGFTELASYLGDAAALICPYGGNLSHIAIQARAAACPCIMNAGQRVLRFETGAVVDISVKGVIQKSEI